MIKGVFLHKGQDFNSFTHLKQNLFLQFLHCFGLILAFKQIGHSICSYCDSDNLLISNFSILNFSDFFYLFLNVI